MLRQTYLQFLFLAPPVSTSVIWSRSLVCKACPVMQKLHVSKPDLTRLGVSGMSVRRLGKPDGVCRSQAIQSPSQASPVQNRRRPLISKKPAPGLPSEMHFIQIGLASSDQIRRWAETSSFLDMCSLSTNLASPAFAVPALPRDPAPSLNSVNLASPAAWQSRAKQVKATKPDLSTLDVSSSGNQTYQSGEVTRADTLNYRSFKPEKDGLFCERIFGPVNDWSCACGHIKEASSGNSKKPGHDHEKTLAGKLTAQRCPHCQVEITSSRFRRYRMGYISLACPVTHIWYLNSRPNLLSLVLKLPTKYIKKIAYYKAYSPSTMHPEYMSSSLGPGGDFFENEWEFMHTWLVGKHSHADIPYPPFKRKVSRESKHDTIQAKDSYHGGAVRNLSNQKMPETPDWLLHTGAQALYNLLKTRDWSFESKKLQSEIESLTRFASHYGLATPGQSSPLPLEPSGIQATNQTSRFSGGATKEKNFLLKKRKRRVRRLKILQTLQKSGFEFSGIIFSSLPVLPPDLRPIIQLGGGQLASSDVNDLYRRILSRNNRLKYYLYGSSRGTKSGPNISVYDTTPGEFSVPSSTAQRVSPPRIPSPPVPALAKVTKNQGEGNPALDSRNTQAGSVGEHFVDFLVRSEQHLVQLAVDALLENGKTTHVRHTPGVGSPGRLYTSLSDRIGGKQGRFRMNLLGKRVDYSGRSVILVGPYLEVSQCGLPYEMALELFQPFVLRHMIELGYAKTIRSAKIILRWNKALGRSLLHRVLLGHPILLNRAPTLHRLGIQAFQPVLVFGRGIHLHPLVCPSFNADFDGDQMAVHIPLSPQARTEARLLMLASGHWLSSSTGQPNILPSQDIVLGFYFVSLEKAGYQKGRGVCFRNLNDVLQAYETGSLDLHSQVWVSFQRIPLFNRQSNLESALTTKKRVNLYKNLPFTGDILSRTSSPKKHIQKFEKADSAVEPISLAGGSSAQMALFSSPVQQSQHTKNLRSRFQREVNQPIEIRLNKTGTCTKLYTTYHWQEESIPGVTCANGYIRTTPGRILINQMIQKYSGD